MQASIWLIAIAGSASLILSNFNSFELGVYEDDAEYVVLARSLVEAGQFGAIYLPDEPGVPLFPFGFPLLLAPLVWAFPRNYDVLKVVSLAATLVNIGLIFWGWPWLSRSTSRWWGVGVMICYSVSPLVVNQARMVMSEPVFTTGCLAACILTERIGRGRAGYRWTVLLGIIVLAIIAIRSVGLVLAAGLLLDLFIALGRRALKLAAIALASAVLAGTFIVAFTAVQVTDILSPTQRYANDFADFASGQAPSRLSGPFPLRLAQRAYDHIVYELRSSVFALGGGDREEAFFVKLGMPFMKNGIGLFLGFVVIAGLLRGLWREGGSAFLGVALVYGGSLLFWNWVGDRFFYPILPQLFLGLFWGVEGLFQWVTRWLPALNNHRAQVAGLIATGIIVVSSSLYRTLHIQPSSFHVGSLAARTEWIRAHTEADAVVMSEVPAVDFLYGERHTVDAPWLLAEPVSDTLAAYLAANGVDYALVAPALMWQDAYQPAYSSRMTAIIVELDKLQASGQVKLVYESLDDMTKVYRVMQ